MAKTAQATEAYVLVIDDERHFTPDVAAPDLHILYARSSLAAIQLLRLAILGEITWTQVWFDHDLGGTDVILYVLKWMQEQNPKPSILECMVHSMNPTNLTRMAQDLEAMGYHTRRVLPAQHNLKVR